MSTSNALPELTCDQVLSFQFSSWYPKFRDISIKSTILRPDGEGFLEYLNADGVIIPIGSDDNPTSELEEEGEDGSEDDDNSSDEESLPRYSFPVLDAQIRSVVKEYGAVFPKLNFTSPQDSAWAVPQLKCFTPADVYMAIKSSDFVNNDLDLNCIFDGCVDRETFTGQYKIELVLKKWYPFQRSREFRCFVREHKLIGISQRDQEFYDFLNDHRTQEKVAATIVQFWSTRISSQWPIQDYVFDVLLTRDLGGACLVDMNPFAPRTHPCLFSYEDLTLPIQNCPPAVRVRDSPGQADVSNYNRVPLEFLYLQQHGEPTSLDRLFEELEHSGGT